MDSGVSFNALCAFGVLLTWVKECLACGEMFQCTLCFWGLAHTRQTHPWIRRAVFQCTLCFWGLAHKTRNLTIRRMTSFNALCAFGVLLTTSRGNECPSCKCFNALCAFGVLLTREHRLGRAAIFVSMHSVLLGSCSHTKYSGERPMLSFQCTLCFWGLAHMTRRATIRLETVSMHSVLLGSCSRAGF